MEVDCGIGDTELEVVTNVTNHLLLGEGDWTGRGGGGGREGDFVKTPLFCDLLLRPTERPSIKRSGRRSRGGGFAECGKVERGTVKWEVVARRRRRRRNGLMVGPQSRTVGSPDGPAEIPLLSPGHSQNRFPYEREERWFPKRSPGQAGRPHFRRPKLAFLTGVDRTPRKELFPGAVDGWDLISLDCSGLDEGHGEDRGSGRTSEAHAGTTPSRGAHDHRTGGRPGLAGGGITLHRPRSSGIGLGRAAPKEKETKHAMVRFLATPGVAPGGGTRTLNGKCTELKLEKVGGSYKLHYGVGYSLITMASALGGLACVH